jgi:hypothetical protein
MSSLPPDLQAASQLASEGSPVAASTLEDTIKQTMRKVLSDRKGQLLMLVFRPFLAAIADVSHETNRPEGQGLSNTDPILRGTVKYLYHALDFLSQQREQPVRHYGCWLLARNIWSAALSLVAACYLPDVVCHLDGGELGNQSFGSPMEASPIAYGTPVIRITGDSFTQSALDACQGACRLLRCWDNESPSLSFCADQLWALVVDAQWHENSRKGKNVIRP